MNIAIIFLSAFIVVFLLGFQSLNVQGRHKWLAVITSIGISIANYFLYKLLPGSASNVYEFLAYTSGGPFGILLSMYAHDKFITKKV